MTRRSQRLQSKQSNTLRLTQKEKKSRSNQTSEYDLDSSFENDDKASDCKEYDLTQSIRQSLSTITSTLADKQSTKPENLNNLFRILNIFLEKIVDKQDQIEEKQEALVNENNMLKNKIMEVENELKKVNKEQRTDQKVQQSQISLTQRTNRSYASVLPLTQVSTAQVERNTSFVNPNLDKHNDQQHEWQVPRKHIKNQKRYTRKYKQNVIILELDPTLMISAGNSEAIPLDHNKDQNSLGFSDRDKDKDEKTELNNDTENQALNSEENKNKISTDETQGQLGEQCDLKNNQECCLNVGNAFSQLDSKLIDKLGLNEFNMHKVFQQKFKSTFQGVQFKRRNFSHLKLFFRGSKEPRMENLLSILKSEKSAGPESFFPSLFKFVNTIRAAKSRPTNYSVVMRGPRLGPNEQEKSVRNGILKEIVETSIDIKIEAVVSLGKGPLVQLFVNSRDEVEKLLNSEITYQGSYLRFRAYENRRRNRKND